MSSGTRLGTTFDTWVASGDFTHADLARYRVVYAVFALVTLPALAPLAELPSSFVNPPLGPFRVLSSFPPSWLLWTIEVGLAVGLGALLVGWRVRTAAVLVCVLYLLGYGLLFSVGKTDHRILFLVLPLVLAFTGWGDARDETTRPRQWPMRFLALVVGVQFATSAAMKALSGWLDPATHASQGHFIRQYVANDRQEWLATPFTGVHYGFFWEAVDWATVLLEGAVILAVLNWRVFRIVLANLTLFHLGILLMMNIPFSPNLVVYGAFVSWGALSVWPALPPGARATVARHRAAAAVVAGLGALLLRWLFPWVAEGVEPPVVLLGAAVGAWYLARQVATLLPALRRAPA
ncbi:MAG: hypothetical protein M3237_17265 [Actinomycetota bacterium]|nr:hypothetical protein [Actinomycetota bacterium]